MPTTRPDGRPEALGCREEKRKKERGRGQGDDDDYGGD
jgi:hypothetical protein